MFSISFPQIMKKRWKTGNKFSVLFKFYLGIPVIAWLGLTFVFYCYLITPKLTTHDKLLKPKLKYAKSKDIIFADLPRPSVEQCETIHIAIVCEQPRNVTTMLVSLLHHRRNPLHLHLIVDDLTEHKIRVLFSTWALPNVNYTCYNTDKLLPPAKRDFGRIGMGTFLLPDILPAIRVIILDADLTILCDVYELWNMFGDMTSTQFIGLVEEQGSLSKKEETRWPAMASYNTGVMLLDLRKVNTEAWLNIWYDTYEVIKKDLTFDKCVVNGVFRADFVYDMFCHYNLQVAFIWKAKHCYGKEPRKVKIINWNSKKNNVTRHQLKKRRLRADVQYFRTIRMLYLKQGDVKLKQKLSGCSELVKSEIDESDVCRDFNVMKTAKFLTHLYYKPYYYQATDNDITLVVQLSIDRLPILLRLCKQWKGPVSAAIYLHYFEAVDLEHFINNSHMLSARRNIAYHLIYKQSSKYYPINYLRNVALENVNTPYVFLMDVDFMLMFGLYEHLKTAIKLVNPYSQKKCIVVPAFETFKTFKKLQFLPQNKRHLLAELHKNVFPFKLKVWEYGHRATNYERWVNATTSYEVEWEIAYEPYLVVPRFVPKFDTRFSGYGFNRASHTMELHASGYSFVVLPDAFIVHTPHPWSYERRRLQNDDRSHQCLMNLKNDFMRDLVVKYNTTYMYLF